MNRILLTSLVALVMHAFLQTPVVADEDKDLEKAVSQMDASGKNPAADEAALNQIAKETGVSKEELRRQKAEHKLGNGSLYIANVLAAKTGKSVDQIVALHRGGRGWGRIAKENNVKVGPLVSDARRLEKDADRAKGSAAREKPDKKTGDAGVRPGKAADKKSVSDRPQPANPPTPDLGQGGGKGRGKGGR